MAVSPSVREFIPSKRISALLIVVGAVVAMAFILRFASGEPGNPNPNDSTILLTEREAVPEKDTDGDGLKDWEEVLWNMNPANADSDGDKIDDKTEVAQKKKQQEAITEAQVKEGLGILFSTEGITNKSKTDTLAQATFAQLIGFQEAGIPITTDTAASIAQVLGQNVVGSSTISVDTFALKDLSVITNPSEEDVHAYGNALGSILGGAPSSQTNELFVFVEFAQTQNPDTLLKLEVVSSHYKNLVVKLTTLSVPAPIAAAHLQLVNGFAGTAASLSGISKLSEDSVGGILALQAYKNHSDLSERAFAALQNYLGGKTTYTSSETGYVILHTQG